MLASRRAPARTAVDGDPQPLVVEVAVEADHHRVDAARVAAVVADGLDAAGLQRLDQPGPPATSARCPGSSSAAVTSAEPITAPAASMPWRGQLRLEHRDRGADELLVTKATSCPAARSRATASAAPGIGVVGQPDHPVEIAARRASRHAAGTER